MKRRRKSAAFRLVLWVWIIPLAVFGLGMLLYPRFRAAIFTAEVVSPVPPLP